ncbi:uncharacterized protein BJ171DRAFT_506904 [Polychytrium aggregatum]|uniref:uncharacterized protein n=1 Tax=Polychytrium aggregatum TaxID=110093 RepID=UPI0022FDF5A6|nr:uncharacterized protein BJ171DRAFT_506904 [Polychytrium aggregatum]KAI9204302.1 hypothetical protein BJ171DRAFT_506904 [Polychytrium aggregatum]
MRLSTVLAAPLILLALSIYVSALSETESANDTSTPAAQPQVLTNNSVHVITDSNYTELRNGDWLVLAYAPWCAFSQAILSHWHLHEDQPESGLGASALRNLTLTNETLRFARVNAQENTRTAALLEIRQYPSIKLILNGTHVWTYSSFSSSSLTDEGSEAEYSPAMIELWVVKKWKQQHILNQLPQSYSIWYKIQLDLHNMISRHSVSSVLGAWKGPHCSACLHPSGDSDLTPDVSLASMPFSID